MLLIMECIRMNTSSMLQAKTLRKLLRSASIWSQRNCGTFGASIAGLINPHTACDREKNIVQVSNEPQHVISSNMAFRQV